MPLQGWINRLALNVLPGQPGYILSWISWFGAVGTGAFIFLTLRTIGVRTREALLALAAYSYVPVVAMMSVIPEKYTWLSFAQMFFIYIMVRMHTQKEPGPRDWLWLSVALGLALSQHSANVILVPVFVYVLARQVWLQKKSRGRAARNLLAGSLIMALITGGFYASLLWMRSSTPWPDWGHLETLTDVWNHAVRTDYGNTKLFNTDIEGSDRVSAFVLLGKGMASWNLGFLFVFIGLFAMTKTKPGRFVWALLLMVLLPGLGVLTRTAMPSADYGTAMGYQERYPLLVWPILILFWGVGLSWLAQRMPRYEKWIISGVSLLLAVFIFQGWSQQRYADTNLAEIYREQASYELSDDYSIFWTSSDFTGFYGIPRPGGVLFPLKNLIGLPWYREHVLPALAPPVARILREARLGTSPALFRQAISEGFKIVVTEPTPFLEQTDIMALAEQTGVLWAFSSSHNALYTKQLIANTLHLCMLLPRVERGLPEDGMYFLREFLSSFRFAFMSAADYLQAQMELPPAQAAREVAASLVPGRGPEDWGQKCEAYMASMRAK